MSDSTGLAELDPVARHRAVAHRFGQLVSATGDWQAPTPVTGWAAIDVVAHLVEWLPAFLAAGGVVLPAGPAVKIDPAGAWQAQADAVQALLDDATQANQQFTHPQAGTHRLDEAIDRFYTADVFMHTWDLARSIGQEPGLDAAYCALLFDGMQPIEDLLRSSGQYGPRFPVADEADAMSRLVAFIGRDPHWQPSSSAT